MVMPATACGAPLLSYRTGGGITLSKELYVDEIVSCLGKEVRVLQTQAIAGVSGLSS